MKKNMIYTNNYEIIKDCDFVIESATEDIVLKKNIFSKVEKIVNKNAILASNTSSIPANKIFSNIKNPDRTAITHFFAPAWKNIPVEVVGWNKTSNYTIDFLCWFFAMTGKLPIVTKDVVCFMLDRIFDNWCNEAGYLLDKYSASQVDRIAEEFTYVGPFFVLNMAKGNSIIVEANSLQMSEGDHYKPAMIFNSVEKWLTCRPCDDVFVDVKDRNNIRNRLLGILFSQTFNILDKKIGNPADLELGCELALGFRKGPLSLMKNLGEKKVKFFLNEFIKKRPGFPKKKNNFHFYQNFRKFILEDDYNGVKIITIRRPQVMNSLSDEVNREILDVLKRYSGDSSVVGFIITGFGNNAFSAGADIGNFLEIIGNYKQLFEYAKECSRVQCYIDFIKKPVVAAVNGLAFGGGLELAIRCHGIIATDNATFQFPEVKLGLLPGIGGCIIPYRRWPDGKDIFNEMLIFAKKIKSIEALKVGMVNNIVEDYNALIKKSVVKVYELRDNLDTCFLKKKSKLEIDFKIPDKKILSKLNLSYEVVSVIISTIKAGVLEERLENALEIGYKAFANIGCSESAREGVGSFIKKRVPNFSYK